MKIIISRYLAHLRSTAHWTIHTGSLFSYINRNYSILRGIYGFSLEAIYVFLFYYYSFIPFCLYWNLHPGLKRLLFPQVSKLRERNVPIASNCLKFSLLIQQIFYTLFFIIFPRIKNYLKKNLILFCSSGNKRMKNEQIFIIIVFIIGKDNYIFIPYMYLHNTFLYNTYLLHMYITFK